MALPAQSVNLGFQQGDHVCAFYNGGGRQLDDLTVDFTSKGLRAGNKCICFIDSVPSVQARIPGELFSRDNILQFLKSWFSAEARVSELAPRYPQFIMCLYGLDLYDGGMVMYVLKTHTKIFVNGLIIANPYYVPKQQFLSELL
ncbi:MAG: hypothetical protein ABSA02_23045 [Trebonia sp.]